eukprot:scaffold90382_cov19-Tisochrysis_lutea.AAC.1
MWAGKVVTVLPAARAKSDHSTGLWVQWAAICACAGDLSGDIDREGRYSLASSKGQKQAQQGLVVAILFAAICEHDQGLGVMWTKAE